jgi:hypothetical protein
VGDFGPAAGATATGTGATTTGSDDRRRRDLNLPRPLRQLDGARRSLPSRQDRHGLPARFLDAQVLPEHPEPMPVVLAIGPSVPRKEHLLARGQHPEDEPGQRLAGDFVAGGAGLGLAGLSAGEHDDLRVPNQKSNQNRTNSRAKFNLLEKTQSLIFEH